MRNENNYIKFNCEQCGNEKETLKSRYTIRKNHFCSTPCRQKFGFNRKEKLLDKICLFCNNPFKGNDIRNTFCSREHGAKFHALKYKKQKENKKCNLCNVDLPKQHRNGICSICTLKEYSKLTLKELYNNYNGNNPDKYGELSARSTIRSVARKLTKLENKCKYCNYSINTELCHIKPISDFSLNSTIAEVNNPSNLVRLCRNHHWELDHGILKLEAITTTTSL